MPGQTRNWLVTSHLLCSESRRCRKTRPHWVRPEQRDVTGWPPQVLPPCCQRASRSTVHMPCPPVASRISTTVLAYRAAVAGPLGSLAPKQCFYACRWHYGPLAKTSLLGFLSLFSSHHAACLTGRTLAEVPSSFPGFWKHRGCVLASNGFLPCPSHPATTGLLQEDHLVLSKCSRS